MNRTKKKSLWLLIPILPILIITLLFPASANAEGIITDGQVPEGETVENDAIVYGDTVTIDGDIQGDLVVVGGEIDINGDVDGSVIVFGRDIRINGAIGGSVYSAGVNLNLKPSTAIDRSIYFAGIRLVTSEGSEVGRDVITASLSGQFAGKFGRDFLGTIGLLQFVDIIREEMEQELESQGVPVPSQQPDEEPDKETRQPSIVSISYQPQYKINGLELKQQHNKKILNTNAIIQSGNSRIQTDLILEWVIQRTEVFLTYLIVGLIFMLIFPTYFNHWTEKIRTSPLSVTGYGLLGFVIALNGFVIFLVLAAIILAIGLGLGYITLWRLAFYFWGISFSSLVLTVFVFALFVFYISKTIVGYLLGLLIVERLTENPKKYRILVFVMGLLIYVLLAAIPYFGWAVGIIAVILGLGSVFLVFRETRQIVPISVEKTE